MYDEMFLDLDLLEKWYDKDFVTLEQYQEIKKKIVESYKKAL